SRRGEAVADPSSARAPEAETTNPGPRDRCRRPTSIARPAWALNRPRRAAPRSGSRSWTSRFAGWARRRPPVLRSSRGPSGGSGPPPARPSGPVPALRQPTRTRSQMPPGAWLLHRQGLLRDAIRTATSARIAAQAGRTDVDGQVRRRDRLRRSATEDL